MMTECNQISNTAIMSIMWFNSQCKGYLSAFVVKKINKEDNASDKINNVFFLQILMKTSTRLDEVHPRKDVVQ